jgi:hypothetical protein
MSKSRSHRDIEENAVIDKKEGNFFNVRSSLTLEDLPTHESALEVVLLSDFIRSDCSQTSSSQTAVRLEYDSLQVELSMVYIFGKDT